MIEWISYDDIYSGANYALSFAHPRKWNVGYHPEKDEMFLWFIDSDQLIWVFRNGGLDSIGFYEHMNFDAAELLGPL